MQATILDLPSVPNLRDVGGHPTAGGGTVRVGRLFRSSDLSRLDERDAAVLARVGIRAVYDLRSDFERTHQPDRPLPGAESVALDVLSGSPDLRPAELVRSLSQPGRAAEILGDGRAAELWRSQYRELVSLESARAGYRRVFLGLLDERRRPALVHCTTGKDRTGWAVAALLRFLGVDEGLVMDDYLVSGRLLAGELQPALERFRSEGGDPELLRPIVETRREYLEAAFDEVGRAFGSIDAYVADGLGLDTAERSALWETFVRAG